MLLRAVGRQMTSVIRQQTAVRNIAMTRAVLGGGHDHHHEPQPVYIPKPGSLSWSLFGSPHSKSAHPFEPYKPDVGSFVGAAVFIGLTIGAVLFKTDTFKKDDGHHHGHIKHSEHKEEHHHEEPKHVEPKETVEHRQPEEILSAREAPAAVEDPVPTTSKQEWEKSSESTETKSAEPEDHAPVSHEATEKPRLPEEVLSARDAPSAVEEPVPSTSKSAQEERSTESKEEVQ